MSTINTMFKIIFKDENPGHVHLKEVLETLELQKPLVLNPTSIIVKGEPDEKEQDVVLPVLVFSCNRPDIRRSLDGLLKYRPDAKKFPIIVSQDCAHGATAEVIRSYSSQVTYIQVEFVISKKTTVSD